MKGGRIIKEIETTLALYYRRTRPVERGGVEGGAYPNAEVNKRQVCVQTRTKGRVRSEHGMRTPVHRRRWGLQQGSGDNNRTHELVTSQKGRPRDWNQVPLLVSGTRHRGWLCIGD